MKATRIALLSAALVTISISIPSAKAHTIGSIYIPSPSGDSRACAFYTDETGQWYAISRSDVNFDEQLFAIGLAKMGSFNVSLNVVGSVCGLPTANVFVNN